MVVYKGRDSISGDDLKSEFNSFDKSFETTQYVNKNLFENISEITNLKTIKLRGEVKEILYIQSGANYINGNQIKIWFQLTDDQLKALNELKIITLKGSLPQSQGAYVNGSREILMPENIGSRSTETVINHELIHIFTRYIVNNQTIASESSEILDKLYILRENALLEINEDDLSINGHVSFNFRKNLDEFLADILTNENLQQALKRKNLYKQAEDLIIQLLNSFDYKLWKEETTSIISQHK